MFSFQAEVNQMTFFLSSFSLWMSIALVLFGAVMLTTGNHRANSNVRSIGLVVISLAFLLGAARFLIDTPAEKCEKRTRQIVAYANDADWTKLQNLMDDDTAVDLSGADKQIGIQAAKGPAIGKAAEVAAKKVHLTGVVVYELRTEQIPDQQIKVTITAAYMVSDTGTAGHASGWEFDYFPPAKSGDHWDLRKIKLLSLDGQPLSG
jgi:hypothetical protein